MGRTITWSLDPGTEAGTWMNFRGGQTGVGALTLGSWGYRVCQTAPIVLGFLFCPAGLLWPCGWLQEAEGCRLVLEPLS